MESIRSISISFAFDATAKPIHLSIEVVWPNVESDTKLIEPYATVLLNNTINGLDEVIFFKSDAVLMSVHFFGAIKA